MCATRPRPRLITKNDRDGDRLEKKNGRRKTGGQKLEEEKGNERGVGKEEIQEKNRRTEQAEREQQGYIQKKHERYSIYYIYVYTNKQIEIPLGARSTRKGNLAQKGDAKEREIRESSGGGVRDENEAKEVKRYGTEEA